jgi:hypothetical protein
MTRTWEKGTNLILQVAYLFLVSPSVLQCSLSLCFLFNAKLSYFAMSKLELFLLMAELLLS